MKKALLLFVFPLLFSCGQKQPECASDATKQELINKLKEEAGEEASQIEDLQVTNIRISSKEKDIQKVKCEATFKVEMEGEQQSQDFPYSVQINDEGKLYVKLIHDLDS